MLKDLKKSTTGKKSEVTKSEAVSKATVDYTVLLHRGIFSPCCGCMIDYACSPSTCDMLDKWLE